LMVFKMGRKDSLSPLNVNVLGQHHHEVVACEDRRVARRPSQRVSEPVIAVAHGPRDAAHRIRCLPTAVLLALMLVESVETPHIKVVKNWAAREPIRDETWSGDQVEAP
jgi:hypothetical protein